MAAPAQAIPKPEKGEVVTDEVLSTLQFSTLAQAIAFAGQSNPSTIWREMILDSQRAYAYYRELEEKDDDVGGAIEEMKLSVTRRATQLTAPDSNSATVEVRDFVQAQLDAFDMDAVIDTLLDAPFYGLALSEVIWNVSSSEIGIADVRDCPQELFTFGPMFQPQVGPLRFMRTGVEVSGGELVPEQKFAIFSYKPRARNRRGQPMLRKVFWLSWFKRQVLKFWLRAGEKGPGTAAVKYANGATPAEQQKALQLAEAMVNKIAIAVPDNIGLVEQLLTQARPQDPKVYEMLFTALQYAIARRVKGETLSSFGNEGGTGSKSMGDTHTETKEERSVSFCKMLERVINLQLIRPLVVWNYGPNAPLPMWTIEKNPQQDLKQRAEIDDTLQAMGLAIPKSYAQKQYGIPEPENEEDTLTRTATAPAPLQATGNQLTQTFADAELKREMQDIDKLLVESLRAAQTIMRDRITNVLSEVRV